MKITSLLITTTAAALLLSGCGNDKNTDLQDSLKGNTVEDKIAGFTVFNPNEGLLPYPNSILFAPNSSSTNDYDYGQTLNIPYEPTDSDAVIKAQLNTLSGFSTIAPITAPISEGTAIDATSLPTGVQFYKVDINSSTGAVTSVSATLQFGVDFVAQQSGENIAIVPLKPLEGGSNYMGVLTSDLNDTDGRVMAPDYVTALILGSNPIQASSAIDVTTAATLEAIRQSNQAMLMALAGAGKDPRKTVQIWSFRTQTIGAVAQAISDANLSGTLGLQDTGLSSSVMLGLAGENNSSLHGSAEVYAGTLSQLPYYLGGASSAYDTTPLTTSFSFNAGSAMPIVQDNRTIPVLASVPKRSAMPANGWPVVIFQHGITQNRTNLLAIAEAFAAVGFAAVAIDLPLHGIDDNSSALYMGALERTFNLDLINNTTLQAGPDGKIDPSGSHYINLASLTTSRDNVRQSTSDLIALTNALNAPAVATDGLKFDASRAAFLGHSLGAIASCGYLSHRTPESVILAMPGGGIAQLLNNSQTFGPVIEAGLAQAGIVKGTAAYESFMIAAQTLLDDGDPDNYAAGLTTRGFLYFEAQNDKVIPNSVATAPLSGTNPLLALTGTSDINLTGVTSNTLVPISGNTGVRFAEPAGHGSILDPTDSLDATVEMQTETAYFLQSKGKQTLIGDPSLILP